MDYVTTVVGTMITLCDLEKFLVRRMGTVTTVTLLQMPVYQLHHKARDDPIDAINRGRLACAEAHTKVRRRNPICVKTLTSGTSGLSEQITIL